MACACGRSEQLVDIHGSAPSAALVLLLCLTHYQLSAGAGGRGAGHYVDLQLAI